MLRLALLVLGIVGSAVSVEIADIPAFLQRGNCASVGVFPKFDLRSYSGRWYQTDIIEIPFQPFTRCINSFYDYVESDYGYKVRTAGFTPTGEHTKMEGKIYPTDKFPASHMFVDFPSIMGSPFEVIDTDYDSYSCVYSCLDWSAYKTEFAFVLSRTPQNNGIATAKCKSVFTKHGIDFSTFVPVPHTDDCVYRA